MTTTLELPAAAESDNGQIFGPSDIGTEALAQLSAREAEITAMAERFAGLLGLKCATPDDYEQTRLAIGECRRTRVDIEKRRKELKDGALKWGKAVDLTAKHLTALVEAIETPLQFIKDEVDQRKAREKREREEAERRRIEEELEAKRREQREKEEAERKAAEERMKEEMARLEKIAAEQKAEREKLEAEKRALEEKRLAEEKRIEAERKAEQDRIDAKRRAEEAELAEKKRKADEEARAEREKIEAERRKFLDEQAAAQRKEAEHLERIRQEQEAKERAEREARELAERLAEAEKIAAEETARRERLKPQAEKMKDFADRITFLVIDAPEITEPELVGTMKMAIDGLQSITDALTAAASK